jgi:hypothetical protein
MNILNDIQKKEDITEFVTTLQVIFYFLIYFDKIKLVQITINGLLKSQKEFKFEALKDLQDSLKDYETLLVQLNGTGKLLRFVTSSRLRRKIEEANSAVHKKLEVFRQSIKDSNPETKSGSNAGLAIILRVVLTTIRICKLIK